MKERMKPIDLKTEYLKDPINIDEKNPLLSWRTTGCIDGFIQSAYRLIIGTARNKVASDIGDLWDSGMVASGESINIRYMGEDLESREDCYWKVKVWDKCGTESEWSDIAYWKMGLLNKSDWLGKWIGYDKQVIKPFDPEAPYYCSDSYDQGTNELHLPPLPYLRKNIGIVKKIKRAFVYGSAMGLYELHINGAQVGAYYFTPGYTDYNKRVYYEVYDVSDMLIEGNNTLGIILSDGWYSGYLGLTSRNKYGDKPRAIVQLEVEYDDGGKDTFTTDETWSAAYGEIREADLYHGEKHDAQLAIKDWDNPCCEFTGWEKCEVTLIIDAEMNAHVAPKNVAVEVIKPVKAFKRADGVWVFDMGKNITGFTMLSNIDEEKGTQIKFDHTELLNEDGTFNKAAYRSARVEDYYVADGSGNETFKPKFTFRSYRYVSVEGAKKEYTADDVRGVFIAAFEEEKGHFTCSNDILNNVYRLISHTIRCGFIEVGMDCCDRDERLGWGQDGVLAMESASYQFDTRNFIKKWHRDALDTQNEEGMVTAAYPKAFPKTEADMSEFDGSLLGDGGIVLPWYNYKMLRDTQAIEQSYDNMKALFIFQAKNADRYMRNCALGDWLGIIYDPFMEGDEGFTDSVHGWGNTGRDLLGTAFFARLTSVMKEYAKVLNKTEDEAFFDDYYKKIKMMYSGVFELRDHLFRDKTQTGYALSLYFNLLSEGIKKHVAKYLNDDVVKRNYSLTTGITGTPFVLDTLSRYGYHETAVKTMANEDYPGFGYFLRMGLTSVPERWDSLHHEKGIKKHTMNSFNHIGYTSASIWYYRSIGGIEPYEAGFKHFKLAPYTEGDIQHADVSYESPYGTIRSSWAKMDGKVAYEFEVPPNTTCEIAIQNLGRISFPDGVEFAKEQDGRNIYRAKSGTYKFTSIK